MAVAVIKIPVTKKIEELISLNSMYFKKYQMSWNALYDCGDQMGYHEVSQIIHVVTHLEGAINRTAKNVEKLIKKLDAQQQRAYKDRLHYVVELDKNFINNDMESFEKFIRSVCLCVGTSR